MTALDELVRLLGPSTASREPSADDWTEVEAYVASALPADFKAFLDAYGTGVICDELVVFHPRGAGPLLDRMRRIHETFGASRRRGPDFHPFPFHPEPGGLISWGYDHSGDEHFFWPCDPAPDRWKVVTHSHGTEPEVFEGPFTAFVLDFVERLRDRKPEHGLDPEALEFLEPEDLAELAERGETGPVEPSFSPL
ncbi:hypothetical protein OG194_27165 [Streptomyces sp. NBC_01288]|uniref:hypothetical protein n=1 Tax=Streptomyces sp. NBC_01288 TaxID=2903814 RepID=UPI002E0FE3EE|nr:hypothetical protein OG194_27165 [Streptomyces sp. NBC_01288]